MLISPKKRSSPETQESIKRVKGISDNIEKVVVSLTPFYLVRVTLHSNILAMRGAKQTTPRFFVEN